MADVRKMTPEEYAAWGRANADRNAAANEVLFVAAWGVEKALRETAEHYFEQAVLADEFAERARLWRLYKEHRSLEQRAARGGGCMEDSVRLALIALPMEARERVIVAVCGAAPQGEDSRGE